jgi:hypothetical protein
MDPIPGPFPHKRGKGVRLLYDSVVSSFTSSSAP